MEIFEYLFTLAALIVAYLVGVNHRLNKENEEIKYLKEQVKFWMGLYDKTKTPAEPLQTPKRGK